jgi:hypothetical protein
MMKSLVNCRVGFQSIECRRYFSILLFPPYSIFSIPDTVHTEGNKKPGTYESLLVPTLLWGKAKHHSVFQNHKVRGDSYQSCD